MIDNTGSRTKRAAQDFDRESPENIKKEAEASFQKAATFLKNPTSVYHPSKKNLKLVSANPLLPDLDAFPDAGGYVNIKFLTNPVPPSSTYDIRLEAGLFKPIEGTEEEDAAKAEAQELYLKDPERYPPPDNSMEFEFFMTETPADSLAFKRKFDVFDPEVDSEDLYPQKNGAGQGCVRFKRIRPYETATVTASAEDKYEDEVIITIHDGSDGLRQKAAYYYPIVQKMSIRPQRTKNINIKKMRFAQSEEKQTDYMDMRAVVGTEEFESNRDQYRTNPFGREVEVEVEAGDED